MKKLVVLLAIAGITIVGCSSGQAPDGTNLVVVKHKKHSPYCTTKKHKHKSYATADADLGN